MTFHFEDFMKTCGSMTLAALRDALPPKLLSGELRVPDVSENIFATT